MISMDTFSRRNKIIPPEIIYNDAPRNLRIGLCNIIDDYIYYLDDYKNLYKIITNSFQIERESGISYKENVKYLVKNKLDWYKIYDLIELIFRNLSYKAYDDFIGWNESPDESRKIRYKFTVDINSLLSNCNIGWKLKNGELQRRGSNLLDEEIIQKTKSLLSNKLFEAPNNQFADALSLLNKRPEPDTKNSIKEAVGALEGLARLLTGKKEKTLGDLIKILVNQGKLKKPLDKILDALWGYSSDKPGIRHGATCVFKPSIEEAFFIVYSCAACMIYLCEIYGYKPSSETNENKEDIPF